MPTPTEILQALRLTYEQILRTVSRSGGSHPIEPIPIPTEDHQALGFTAEQILRIVSHSVSSHPIEPIPIPTEDLQALGFTAEQILRIVSHSGGSHPIERIREDRFFAAPPMHLESKNDAALERVSFSGEIPEQFICPLSMTIMDDPVYNPAFPSRCFERSWILGALRAGPQDPYTQEPLEPSSLVANTALRDEIRSFVESVVAQNSAAPKS